MRKRNWSEKQLKIAAKKSRSIRQIIGILGLIPAGGNYNQINKYLKFYNINISHLKGKGWKKGLSGLDSPRIPLGKILVEKSEFQSYKLKKRLFDAKIKPRHCEECGWHKETAEGRLPLELDHINGDSKDNRLENLRVLCPNCHSLKPTHRGRNIKK